MVSYRKYADNVQQDVDAVRAPGTSGIANKLESMAGASFTGHLEGHCFDCRAESPVSFMLTIS